MRELFFFFIQSGHEQRNCVWKLHSLLLHPLPLCCRLEAWQLQKEDLFQELLFAFVKVQRNRVTQHAVKRVCIQQHRHILPSNTDLRADYFHCLQYSMLSTEHFSFFGLGTLLLRYYNCHFTHVSFKRLMNSGTLCKNLDQLVNECKNIWDIRHF